MGAVVRRVLGEGTLFEEKDVSEDPDLERRFVFEIPVLLLGTQEIARHRVSEADLRTRLAALGIPLRG
jgi:hypothetical protein